MQDSWEGESPSSNLMEVKDREAQGRYREIGSEGSVYQKIWSDEQKLDIRQ